MYPLASRPSGVPGRAGVAEDVAGREVVDAVVLGEAARLGSLACTLLAEQHESWPRDIAPQVRKPS